MSPKPPGPVDKDKEIKKASEKYGEKIGGQLKDYIEQNMADYEHLSEFKV